jgi:threonine/homoserine/homoserine lactone efflux protein
MATHAGRHEVSSMSERLLSLVLFVTVTTVSPGGATALATASGAQFGLRRSLPLIGGVAIGLASLAAAAAAGLAGLILAVPSAYLVMKIGGSIYLFWLAWKIGSSSRPDVGSKMAAAPLSFVAGAMLLWLNPKAWAMTLGAAASFAALATGPIDLAIILGVAFGISATILLSLWCLAGLVLTHLLRSELHWRLTYVALGLLLAASVVPIWLE